MFLDTTLMLIFACWKNFRDFPLHVGRRFRYFNLTAFPQSWSFCYLPHVNPHLQLSVSPPCFQVLWLIGSLCPWTLVCNILPTLLNKSKCYPAQFSSFLGISLLRNRPSLLIFLWVLALVLLPNNHTLLPVAIIQAVNRRCLFIC